MVSPTIRVSEQVFKGLQKLAEPFVDTPGDVIEKILIKEGVLNVNPVTLTQQRAKKGEITPQYRYEEFLLKILFKYFNGKAHKNEVTEEIIKVMDKEGVLKEVDGERLSSGEIRAENGIAWGRNALKDKGFIRRDSQRGVWELTEAGIQ